MAGRGSHPFSREQKKGRERSAIADAHFAKLADEYHEINRAVHRAETNVEPLEELAEVELRKKRGALKDEIWNILAKA